MPLGSGANFESLRRLTIEETYELGDAILQADLQEIKKELGDLLLHIVFYSKIGSEQKAFDITDVINSLNEKLIYRHPHIYGEVDVNSAREVEQNWEALKLKEKGEKEYRAGRGSRLVAGFGKGKPDTGKSQWGGFRLGTSGPGVGQSERRGE